jgi:LPS-assembly protein
MRTRTTLCITLFLLCHPNLHAVGVTKQLPSGLLLDLAGAPRQNTPQQQTPAPSPTQQPSPQPQDDPAPVGITPLTPGADPAFSPPPDETPGTSQAQPLEPEEEQLPAPVPLVIVPVSDIVNAGTAIPIDAPPVGTPVHIEATKQGKAGDVYTLDGDVLILYKTYRIRADHAMYDTSNSTVVANGHVTVDGGPSDEHIVADHGTMNLDAHTAHYYDASGTLGVRSVTHDRFVFTAPNPFAGAGPLPGAERFHDELPAAGPRLGVAGEKDSD